MEQIKNIYEVTQRLCGMIEPQGDSRIDEIRFENLVNTIDVVSNLIEDIISVARYKHNKEASMKKAGEFADNFITDLTELLNS